MSDPVGGFSAGAPRRVMDRGGQEFNVKAFGGVSGTDHTTLLATYLPEVIGVGGVLLLPPGYDMHVGNLVTGSQPWGIRGAGSGATITHIGDNSHLVEVRPTVVGSDAETTGFSLERLTLKAKQSSTNPTQALLYLQKCSDGVFRSVNFQGGDKYAYRDGVSANRYARYCLYVYARQNQSVYYNDFYSPRFHGANLDNVYWDAWDAAYSGGATNVGNQNHFYAPSAQDAGRYGWNVQSGAGNQVFGGTSEQNASFGWFWGPHPIAWEAWGHRCEGNNGGNANAQFGFDGSPAAASLQSNIYVGPIGKALTQAERGYFLLGSGPGTQRLDVGGVLGVATRLEQAPTSTVNATRQVQVVGEAYPRLLEYPNGQVRQGDGTFDPSGGSALISRDAPISFSPKEVGPGSDVLWSMRGGGKLGGALKFTASNEISPASGVLLNLSYSQGAGVAVYLGDSATEMFRVNSSGMRLNTGSVISRMVAQSASLTWGSIAAGATAEQTIALAITGGISGGDFCVAGVPNNTGSGYPEAGLMWAARIKDSNTTVIRMANVTAGAITPFGGTANTHKTLAMRN